MNQPAGRVQDGIAVLTADLSEGDIDQPAREARMIMAHVIGIDASRMSLHVQDALSADALGLARSLGSRRLGGEPLSHIRGYRDFWGRRFQVDRRVLDPRPETECLVAEALREPFSQVLDLGTGSGCILITLLAERASAVGLGVDASAGALEVARANAGTHGVDGRCALEESDWFGKVDGRYDLIVSNPPYIALEEMEDLAPGVTGYEPRMALTDEGDGLGAYRRIAAGAPQHLAQGGRLLVEIGPTQGRAVAALFTAAGLEDVRLHPDFDGRDRVVSGRANPG
ncbi:peptide chain release factor N(5)-glutamine methyltransferase [Tropicimonas marinistellae]|uniref:peptide chain release factor N(5)-glutamine methyltransferase n=1 Tax=Tropicimonas marinistellae TaxID=1739787 RepID=UPI000A880B05|nr:peptide chain release factor N(5)-glutamine methyltransferase [Tropicimonas marinistellae]